MTPRAVLIAIHDVAPTTLAECRGLLQWVHDLDPRAPVTLLCVPQFHGGMSLEQSTACRSWIDACIARGDEVALHGYRHRDEGPEPNSAREWVRRRMLTAREGEFATLDAERACERIERGLAMFERCGWRVSGFVPPAWLMNPAVLAGLSTLPLDYCTDSAGFHCMDDRGQVSAPVIGTSARSGWRRAASRAWLAASVRHTAAAECVRVALHPEDARHPQMREAWTKVLEKLLMTRQPLTKASWLRAQSKSVGSVRSA